MSKFTSDLSLADPSLANLIYDAIEILDSRNISESLYIPADQLIPVKIEFGIGIITRPIRINNQGGSFAYEPSTIVIGTDFFKHDKINNTTGLGYRLLSKGATPADAILCCLAHELFHVDESFRQCSFGTTFFEANSRFSSAIRPSFPIEVNTLLRKAADLYQTKYQRKPIPGTTLMPIDVARAQDVATELCADLLAFHWMKKAGIDTSSIEQVILSLRISDEQSLEEYQTSVAMEKLLGLGKYDDIVKSTMDLSIDLLANGSAIDSLIKDMAQSCKHPISLTHSESEIIKFQAKPTIKEKLLDRTKPLKEMTNKAAHWIYLKSKP